MNHELDDQIMSEKQLAAYLGMTVRGLINWRQRGILPHWRIGRRCIKYRKSDVLRALDEKYRHGGI